MRFILMVLFASALLHLPLPVAAAEPPLVILMPGGAGAARPGGFLVRNRSAFESAGFRTLVSSTSQEAVRAAKNAKAKGRKVYLVGISIGVAKAVAALEAGAPVDAAVFYSGAYGMAQPLIQSPEKLPPVLVVHHRQDKCPVTTPESAESFRNWSKGKVVRIVWIRSSGDSLQWICGPKGAHGFFRKDQEPISAALTFLKSH